MGLVGTVISAVENGYVPDWMFRLGVRRQLRESQKRMGRADIVTRQEKTMDFISFLKKEPIAVIPDVANIQHYELPAEFFLKVLGPRLKYSCCLYEKGGSDLAEAEEAMLRLTVERAGLKDGDRVLDLGCGWGSLSFWIAENFPNCQVTAVSNSKVQRSHIMKRGMPNLKVITADVNTLELTDSFDRIISIECFEHLRNYEQILKKCHSWLKPNGKMFIHIFCHRHTPYFLETEAEDDWMGRHFFAQGSMPSHSLLTHFQSDLKLEYQWVVNGRHYQKTLEAWLQEFDRRSDEISEIFKAHYGTPREAKIWMQRWRMFFISCSESFGYQKGEEWYVSHYLFRK